MSKINFAVYPVVAVLSLAAAFAAHAQSANDPVDQAGYGPMAAATVSTPVKTVAARQSLRAALASRTVVDNDPIDHAGYGATNAPAVSLRTRAEVRAEAIAARNDGSDMLYREGGETVYALTHRAKTVDASRVLAGVPAKAAQ